MSITFQCPNPDCKKRMTVKDEFAGKKGACVACKQRRDCPLRQRRCGPLFRLRQHPPRSRARRSSAPTSPADLEAEAAAFFSDGPASPPEPVPLPPSVTAPKPVSARPPAIVPKPAPAPKTVPPPLEPPPKPIAPSAPSPAVNGQAPPQPGDVESEAAAFFSDAPKAEAVATSIKFNCEFCDHPMEVGLDMANKRTPCPECRRIIKVPDIAKPVKKDWLRNAAGRESAGRGDGHRQRRDDGQRGVAGSRRRHPRRTVNPWRKSQALRRIRLCGPPLSVGRVGRHRLVERPPGAKGAERPARVRQDLGPENGGPRRGRVVARGRRGIFPPDAHGRLCGAGT